MRKHLSMLLTVCLCGGLLAGCGTTGQSEKDTSIGDAASVVDKSISLEVDSANEGDTSHNSHEPVISSKFDVNGIHFEHHDGTEMECLVLQSRDLIGQEFAEITLDGVMLHIDVKNEETAPEEYQNIVQNGSKGINTNGDLIYSMIGDSLWDVATDSGKILTLYGEQNSGDDWKSIAKMLEWNVIDGSSNSGTEHGYTIKNGLLVPGSNGENMKTAGKPVTENNTTLNDVVISNIYESQADMMAVMGDNEHVFADEVCYNLGMALWDYGDGTEGGYIPFWAFFLPSDGTITFSTKGNASFEENPYIQIDGFTMKEEEKSEEQWPLKSEELKYWNATFTGRYVSEKLSAGDHTVSLSEIREAIPVFDVLVCWWGDTYILAVCVK